MKRVYFVLDGALALTPLAALWLPDTRMFPHAQIEVAVAPSLSALALRRTSYENSQRPINGPALLVGAPATSASPLMGGRQEVLELSELVSGPADLLLGPKATRQAILGLDLGTYSLMHFATHGINSGDATASGLLVRQSDEDRSDALISAKDIFTWRLRADLITLSACETLVGDSAGGDDPGGIARAFAYAGARAVLGSLWQVDDAATRFFMNAFYSRYLEDGNATAALRHAQLKTATHPAWRDPYYWAGFQLHST